MSLVLEQFLPYRLNRLADSLSKNASQAYKSEYGLSRPEWRAFALLGQQGTMTATEIAHFSTMDKTKVSRALYALEKRSWLIRNQDDKDRRLEHLALTPAGQKAYEILVPKMLKIETDMIARLGETNFAALNQGLDALESLFADETIALNSK
ncbi:MarR family transcriptional regulator [Sneathiella marina]|uniref:MarR family transcriptional regulator n=1 Tax=Sneathiella marina TaxID=2950108 RepID=A0ABY4W700_9PROT|nr:MarR family transcriptional regulator [Sneathiella marina]USG61525.1 MarR family transcriptional regulator [Sneathiella marina]